MTVSVSLWFVSLKCCSAFVSNVRFKSVNPSKILISLFMLGYPFEGIFGQTGCSRAVLFYFYTKKPQKGTNNQSRERVVISTKYFRT